MTKRDSSIANTTVTKGTDGVEWLRFLQDPGEAARRPDGNLAPTGAALEPGGGEKHWLYAVDALAYIITPLLGTLIGAIVLARRQDAVRFLSIDSFLPGPPQLNCLSLNGIGLALHMHRTR